MASSPLSGVGQATGTIIRLWYDGNLSELDPQSPNFADEASDRESSDSYVALRHSVALTHESSPKWSNERIEEGLLKGVDLQTAEIDSLKCGMVYEKVLDSEDKTHLTVMDCENDNHNYSFYMKGDLDKVLSQCSSFYMDGNTTELDDAGRKSFSEACAAMKSLSTCSVFAFADRTLVIEKEWEELKEDLVAQKFTIPKTGWRLIGLASVDDCGTSPTTGLEK